MYYRIAVIILLSLLAKSAKAQEVHTPDSSLNKLLTSPEKYIASVSSKANILEQKLDKKSAKAITQLKKQEEKIIRKLQKIDSSAAKQLMENAAARYKLLEEKLKNPGKLSQYIPRLDSLGTSLNFLNQHSQLLSNAKEVKDKLQEAMKKMDELKAQLQKAEDIKQFLKERKQYLKEQLSKFGFAKELKKINKQAYYYSQQLVEYKEILKDPKKIEKKALELLSKTKIWKDFFAKNSMLASFLGINYSDVNNASSPAIAMTGLQARAQIVPLISVSSVSSNQNIQQLINQNVNNGSNNQINQYRNQISRLEKTDGEMPDFKPNNQKGKPLAKRLEYGFIFQTLKASYFFPTTSDLGLSVGYKLNDKSTVGLGASFKIGLGNGWDNIHISGQGIGLRSYVDWKLKNRIYASGGYERNFRSAFGSFEELRNISHWQQSGLLGLGRQYKLNNKIRGKIYLLWDFLSYQQMPRTQPIILRFGFSFK